MNYEAPHVLQIECDVLGKIIGWEWSERGRAGGKRKKVNKKFSVEEEEKKVLFPFD